MEDTIKHRSNHLPTISASAEKMYISSPTGSRDTVARKLSIQSDGSLASEKSDTNIDQSLTFDPLDEDAVKYLEGGLTLPPIHNISPNKCYINPHPTESDMSSSINSMNEWWNQLDLGDKDGCCVEELYTKRREVSVKEADQQLSARQNVFPLTEETLRKRRLSERRRQEDHRAQIITHLEKQMVSLSNIKEQYRKNLKPVGGDWGGCLRGQGFLPPAVTEAADALTRHRDSIINRIKRKKLEEELKGQKQTERKLSIVKKLLREQRKIEQNRKERQLKKMEHKKVERSKQVQFIDEEGTKISSISDEVVQENESVIIKTEVAIDETPYTVDKTSEDLEPEPQASSEVIFKPNQQQMDDTMESPVNMSSKKKGRKKKSLSGSEKGKSKKEKKKKKISAQSEAPAATCAETVELPASQLQDLLLWFENWRESRDAHDFIKNLDAQNLPLEKYVVLKPSTIIFKDVRGRRITRQIVTVTNVGESPLRCRLAGVFIPISEESPKLLAELDGPSKARTGNFWTLTLNLEAEDKVEDTTGEVVLMFCREDGSRSQLRQSVLVLKPRAEPSLNTTCIRFGRQMAWAVGVSKLLLVSNPGSLSCKMHWTKDSTSTDLTKLLTPSGETPEAEGRSELQLISEATLVAEEMVEIAFQNVFCVFRFEARSGLTIRPKSQVSLPIKFIPTLSDCQGHVFSKYRFTFEGEHVDNAIQHLVVCGEIEAPSWTLDPQLLDLKMCYTGGGVQQAEVKVCSSARHVCVVCSRVPPALVGQVTILPRQTLLQAKSSVTLTVRLTLRWDLYDSPCQYLDRESGLLSFGIPVWVQGAGPPRELEVMAVVVPPCPLNITPAILDLGRITTAETVSAVLLLKNHQLVPYTFAFVNLPKSISIEPGGGVGTILPGETLSLDVLFSPTSSDLGVNCGRPGAEGEVAFTLHCYTTVSLASPVQRKKKSSAQPKAQSISRISSKVLNRCSVLTSELSHGSGDVANFTPGSTVAGGSADDSTTIESSTVKMGGGDVEFEPIVEEGSLSETNSELPDIEKASSSELDFENLWDYYSAYQLNGIEMDNRRSTETFQVSLEEEGDRANEEDRGDIREGVEVSDPRIDEEENNRDKEVILDDQKVKEPSLIGDMPGGEVSSNNKEDGSPNDHIEEEETSQRVENNMFAEPSEEILLSDATDEELKKDVNIAGQRFTSVTVRAWVTDPLVELSSQIVLLPLTPCMSYSLAQLYIRSRPQIRCGVHEKINSFQTWFEFRSSNKYLSVEPKQGRLRQNQSEKITIIFRPSLSHDEIFNRAFEMKMEKIKWQKMQEMLEEYYQSKAKKEQKAVRRTSTKGGKPSKKADDTKSKKGAKSITGTKKSKAKSLSRGSVISSKTKKSKGSLKMSKQKKKDSEPLPDVTVNPEDVKVLPEDLLSAEMWLLKYFEPETSEVRVTCLLVTEFDSGERRLEKLECLVVCQTVPPAIVMASLHCLDFGPTAVGTSSNLHALATNASMFDEFVKVSTLNPVGPFMCPASLETPYMIDNRAVEVPPEHFLKVPIVFHPTVTGVVVERFELICGLTVYHLEARGEGVTASCRISPETEVFNLACAAGKKADLVVTVENTCRAPLHFLVRQEFLRKGTSLPTSKPSSPLTNGSVGKPKKEKKTKAEPGFTLLTQDLSRYLETDFLDLTVDDGAEPIFKIVDVNESFDVLAGEMKEITIRFTPPQTVKSRNGTESSVKTKIGKKDKTKKVNTEKGVVQNIDVKSTKKSKTKEKLTKKSKKELEETKEKIDTSDIGKEKVKTGKMIIATKYSIFYPDMRKVKDLIILGTTKK